MSWLRFPAHARAAARPAVSIWRRRRQLWGLFGASRSKALAEGWPRSMSWLRFPAHARAAARPAVSIWRRRRELSGLFGASRSKALAEGWLWRVCALAFQAGEIVLLIRGRAGAKAARGEFLVALAAGSGRRRGRRRFPVWHSRSAVAELSATACCNSWPEGSFSDGLALCWILESAARDRSLNLHLKGAAFHVLASFPRAREGGRSASGFDLAAPAPAMGLFGASRSKALAESSFRREPIESAGRGVAVAGVRSGISGWRDRAPDPWACGRQGGARRIPGRPGRRFLARLRRGRRRFPVWHSRSAVAELFGQQPLATAGRRGSFPMGSHSVGFWNWPRATAP